MKNPNDWPREILLEGSRLGARLFRRFVGFAYTGSKIIKNADGSVLILDARPVKVGVKGESDTGGWLTVIVTADMVGKPIAQFVAIEGKQGTGRLTDEQAAYIDVVVKTGGRAGVARNLDDVRRILG